MSTLVQGRQYFVSSSHHVGGGAGAPRTPVGILHARAAGDRHTMCGKLAWEWPIHFDRDFDTSDPHTCLQCARLLGVLPGH